MTFRDLESREVSHFSADARVFSRPAHSLDNPSPSGRFHTAPRTMYPDSDGDCLRALGMALAIEALFAAVGFGVWMLWQMLR
jgi:hypothetical protein